MKNKIVVGTPTKLQYSRLELENMAKNLFSENYIEELTDSELFNMIIKEQCSHNKSQKENL